MPDTRRHRGPHPADADLFAPDRHPALRAAASDLAWLLARGYAAKAALKLVGDRYDLTTRQRKAVQHAACPEEDARARQGRRVAPEELTGRALLVDGFNVLITIESALADGVVLVGLDGALRDLASVHGTYRRVAETLAAVDRLGAALARHRPGPVTWLLDRPVSNSGRLRALLLERAEAAGWRWEVALSDEVDRTLAGSAEVVATSDSWILDRCQAWLDLPGLVLARDARVIDLRSG